MSLTLVKILWVHCIIADGIMEEICARGEMVMCICIFIFLSFHKRASILMTLSNLNGLPRISP